MSCTRVTFRSHMHLKSLAEFFKSELSKFKMASTSGSSYGV